MRSFPTLPFASPSMQWMKHCKLARRSIAWCHGHRSYTNKWHIEYNARHSSLSVTVYRVWFVCSCGDDVGRLPIHLHLRPFLHIYFHLFRLFIYGLLLSYAISSMSSSFLWISVFVPFFLLLFFTSSFFLLYYITTHASSQVGSRRRPNLEVHHSNSVHATTARCLRISSQPSLFI